MDTCITIEIIKIFPSILGFIFALILLIIFYHPIRYDLLPRIGSAKLFGVEVSFEKKLRSDIEKAGEQRNLPVNEFLSAIVAQRAARLLPLIKGRRILWVDDNPRNNLLETDILESLGLIVFPVTSSNEALKLLKVKQYDLIISDIRRESSNDAGIQFLDKIVNPESRNKYKVIFYAGEIDYSRGLPPYAFGMTARIDELLHLVFDALERSDLGNY